MTSISMPVGSPKHVLDSSNGEEFRNVYFTVCGGRHRAMLMETGGLQRVFIEGANVGGVFSEETLKLLLSDLWQACSYYFRNQLPFDKAAKEMDRFFADHQHGKETEFLKETQFLMGGGKETEFLKETQFLMGGGKETEFLEETQFLMGGGKETEFLEETQFLMGECGKLKPCHCKTVNKEVR